MYGMVAPTNGYQKCVSKVWKFSVLSLLIEVRVGSLLFWVRWGFETAEYMYGSLVLLGQ